METRTTIFENFAGLDFDSCAQELITLDIGVNTLDLISEVVTAAFHPVEQLIYLDLLIQISSSDRFGRVILISVGS